MILAAADHSVSLVTILIVVAIIACLAFIFRGRWR